MTVYISIKSWNNASTQTRFVLSKICVFERARELGYIDRFYSSIRRLQIYLAQFSNHGTRGLIMKVS